jgi:outer membrane protein OmpA-like peptidoglycan-associated protein
MSDVIQSERAAWIEKYLDVRISPKSAQNTNQDTSDEALAAGQGKFMDGMRLLVAQIKKVQGVGIDASHYVEQANGLRDRYKEAMNLRENGARIATLQTLMSQANAAVSDAQKDIARASDPAAAQDDPGPPPPIVRLLNPLAATEPEAEALPSSDVELASADSSFVPQGAPAPNASPPPRQASSDKMVKFKTFVPADCPSMDKMFRILERVAFGKEVNHTWTCPANCTIDTYRGKQVEFEVAEALLSANSDPAEAQDKKKRLDDFHKLDQGQQAALSKEADRRVREQTHDKEGAKQTDGEMMMHDRELAGVMQDRELLQALPQDIKDFLFGKDGQPLKPEDYKALLRIADKLKQFSKDDFALFKQLPMRPANDMKQFEDSIDLFLAHKEEIRKAATPKQDAQAPGDPSMQDAISEQWKGFDKVDVAAMTDDQRYVLAEQKANDVSKAQLKYMATHPGSTLKDFAKSATLMNTGETADAIGKDLAEAADGDANGWARAAAGAGAGAKLSGWALAVIGVLYVASWATGVGELATIGAAAGYALATTMALTAVEHDLRLKAASQAKTPEEFEHDVNDMAATQTTIAVTIAGMVTAAVLHFSAKALFPEAIENLHNSIKNLRDMIRGKTPLAEIKTVAVRELTARKIELVKAADTAKAQAAATAKQIGGMTPEQFVEWMQKNHSFLDNTGVPPGQKGGLAELLKSEMGRKAVADLQQRATKVLSTDLPTRMDQLAKMHSDAADAFLAEIDKATTPEQLEKAAETFEQAVAKEKANDLLKSEQDKLAQQIVEDGQKELDKQVAEEPAREAENNLKDKVSRQPTLFEPKYSRQEVVQILDKAKELGLDTKTARDMMFQGSRKAKPLTAAELMKQMEWAKEVKDRGYPFKFKDKAEFEAFGNEVKAELKKIGVPDADVRVQGSSARNPGAGDVDVAVFMDEAAFDKALIDRFSGRAARKVATGFEPIDMKGMSHDDLMNLAKEIEKNDEGFNGQADTFQRAMRVRQILSLKDIVKGLEAARKRISAKFPDLKLNEMSVLTGSSDFDLEPSVSIK